MNRQSIDRLIVLLVAIENAAKDIHYTCSGSNFYGNHLLADRIGDGIDDFLDQLKETCLLGHNLQPLLSAIYLKQASDIIPTVPNFVSLKELMVKCLIELEHIDGVARGDSKLLDDIGCQIQNNIGLLNIMQGESHV